MNVKFALTAISLLSLTACGGGSGESTTPEPTPPAATISGKVIDGYVSGATVFLDLNGNAILDNAEPSAVTGENGDYFLDLDTEQYACQAYVPLVVDVPVGATDSDTGEVTQAYQMVYPPLMNSPFETGSDADITPLTTIIWESLKSEFLLKDEDFENPNFACDAISNNHDKIEELARHIEQTLGDMVRHYNISQEAIFSDYIANADTETHELALLIVKGLKKGFAEANELKETHPNSTIDVKYLKTSEGWVRKEYIFTPSSDTGSEDWADHATVESNTYSVSDDLEILGEQVDFYNRRGAVKNIGEDTVELATSEETCNDNEYLNYFEVISDNAIHEREVTNITSTCDAHSNQKYVFNMNWSDKNKRLGTIGQYIIRFDIDAQQFLMLSDLHNFYPNRNELDFEAINAEIDSLDYHYDDEIIDTTDLSDVFSFVILTKMVEENGLRVEYQKVMSGVNGWNYETTRFNADGTYSKECKAWDEDNWSDCE